MIQSAWGRSVPDRRKRRPRTFELTDQPIVRTHPRADDDEIGGRLGPVSRETLANETVEPFTSMTFASTRTRTP